MLVICLMLQLSIITWTVISCQTCNTKTMLGKYFKGNLIRRMPELLHNYRVLSNDERIEMVRHF